MMLARKPPAPRRGASLTEVLMALMIMAIGLSSIFTLFPLSIVRSIRATQLTNAQLLSDNVDQIFRLNPDYFCVHRFQTPQSSTWQAGTSYAARTPPAMGDTIRPQGQVFRVTNFNQYRTSFNYRFLQYEVTRVNDPMAGWTTPGSGTSDADPMNEPAWPDTDTPVDDGQLRWEPVVAKNWVVDPLGWNAADNDQTFGWGTNTDGTSSFGIWADDRSGTTGKNLNASPVTSWQRTALPRSNAGITSFNSALSLAAHPDAWSEVGKFIPIDAPALNQLTLPPGTDIASSPGPQMRVAVRNSSGTKSFTTSYTYSAPTLTLGQNLPLDIKNNLGTLSIEALDSRYTWFATVNNTNSPAVRNLAVVFKRKFTPGEEHVYRAVHGVVPISYPASEDTTGEVKAAFDDVGPVSEDQVLVVWNSLTEPSPLIQEGSYLFDPAPTDVHGIQWYKIVAVTGELRTSSNVSYRVVTLDRRVLNTTATFGLGRAMFIRGLIEVYPL